MSQAAASSTMSHYQVNNHLFLNKFYFFVVWWVLISHITHYITATFTNIASVDITMMSLSHYLDTLLFRSGSRYFEKEGEGMSGGGALYVGHHGWLTKDI